MNLKVIFLYLFSDLILMIIWLVFTAYDLPISWHLPFLTNKKKLEESKQSYQTDP